MLPPTQQKGPKHVASQKNSSFFKFQRVIFVREGTIFEPIVLQVFFFSLFFHAVAGWAIGTTSNSVSHLFFHRFKHFLLHLLANQNRGVGGKEENNFSAFSSSFLSQIKWVFFSHNC
jgi:hypothetical protein